MSTAFDGPSNGRTDVPGLPGRGPRQGEDLDLGHGRAPGEDTAHHPPRPARR
ncbi:pseudouridine synthase, partial [Nocardiopsis sp. MG754419]|nr:pseudouridine synthase [Nocardiopsis sp. MG754419]